MFVLTVGQFLPIEIINATLRSIFYIILLIGLPIAVYYKLRPFFIRLTNPSKKIARILIFILSGLYLFVFFIFFTFGLVLDMCGYSTTTLYVRKGCSNSTIIIRGLSCGAYDGGYPKFETVNKINVLSLLQIVPTIDTLKIDKNKWIKVESKEK